MSRLLMFVLVVAIIALFKGPGLVFLVLYAAMKVLSRR